LPFRDNARHLRDILEAIDHIELCLNGMTLESYRNDLKTKSAEERQLQIMTEAAIRLGDDAQVIAPSPDWEGFRGIGNILRHAYHRVDDQIVWNTVTDELPPMRDAVSKALRSDDSESEGPIDSI
jgi:uncharacterized protein with HEPN domain